MKTNLEYDWRIELLSPKHRITVTKHCTFEQALLTVDEMETEVDWLVMGVFISRQP